MWPQNHIIIALLLGYPRLKLMEVHHTDGRRAGLCQHKKQPAGVQYTQTSTGHRLMTWCRWITARPLLSNAGGGVPVGLPQDQAAHPSTDPDPPLGGRGFPVL